MQIIQYDTGLHVNLPQGIKIRLDNNNVSLLQPSQEVIEYSSQAMFLVYGFMDFKKHNRRCKFHREEVVSLTEAVYKKLV